MKLLVVVETLKGSDMTWSIASTLMMPAPMPSSAESTPPTSIRANPTGIRRAE